MVNEDGSFTENWQTHLTDTTLHEDQTLKTFSNLEGLAKSYVHVRRQVPMDKITIPTETSTEEEWNAYYKAGGRPETVADYNLAKPEDMPEELYDIDLAGKAQELFHKIGLSKKQADALFKFNNDNVLTQVNSQNVTAEAAMNELKEGLYKDWGAAYEQKKHLGNLAIEKGTEGDNSGLKDRVIAKYGNDPDLIRFMSNIGSKFAETGVVTTTQIPTPADIKAVIAEEMAKDSYTNARNPQHKAQVQKVFELRKQLTGEE
jgi:hypothetical protein